MSILQVLEMALRKSQRLSCFSLADVLLETQLLLHDLAYTTKYVMWTVSENNITSLLFQHCAIEDNGDVVVENPLVGEGLVGVVEEVTVQTQSEPTICAREKIF